MGNMILEIHTIYKITTIVFDNLTYCEIFKGSKWLGKHWGK